jgi:hypothetical protein
VDLCESSSTKERRRRVLLMRRVFDTLAFVSV